MVGQGMNIPSSDASILIHLSYAEDAPTTVDVAIFAKRGGAK
jgi:hypothetical protein